MARTYKKELDNLPKVEVPDWELLRRLEELVNPYRDLTSSLLPPPFSASDKRGTYDAYSAEELQAEAEAQEESPHSINIWLVGEDRAMRLDMGKDTGSHGVVTGTDAAFVNHVSTRIQELFLRAYVATAPPSAFESGTSFGQPEPEPKPGPEPEKWGVIWPPKDEPEPEQPRYGTAEVEFDPQLQEREPKPSLWKQHTPILIIEVLSGLIVAGIVYLIFGNY
jgi:hypothetical protein